MDNLMIKIDNVTKQYKLGQIGSTTLKEELQRLSAKFKGKEDPTRRIGAKEYEKGEIFMALDGVKLEIKKGERVGIIGHNGAGKSTLLKLISRVTAPSSGMICLNGRVASMLEVGTGFHGELTGRENIYMNGAILGMTKKEIESKIEDIIDFSEVRQFIDTPVKRYSSGMYVKLAFSVAAHLDSEIMIMDEVLAVGDMAFQKKCLNKMNDVSRTEGRTILYVSHNMNTIRQLCERVIVLDHGKIIFDGDVEEGIGVYMDWNVSGVTKVDYRNVSNPGWISNPKIQMKSVEFLEKEATVYQPDEPVKLGIKWKNLKRTEKLCLRFEIWSIDGRPIATSFMYNIGDFEAQEQSYMEIEADIHRFVPATYHLKLVFFEKNSAGTNVNIGYAGDIFFEVQQDIDAPGAIVWDSKSWGFMEFEAPEMVSIESEIM